MPGIDPQRPFMPLCIGRDVTLEAFPASDAKGMPDGGELFRLLSFRKLDFPRFNRALAWPVALGYLAFPAAFCLPRRLR